MVFSRIRHGRRILGLLCMVTMIALSAHVRAGEGEGGAEAGGEGGDKKDQGSADKPWIEVQNHVSAWTTKTKQSEDKLHELIEEKKKTTSNERMHELDQEIEKTYKEYKDSNAELRRQEQIFKYRFPERAAKDGDRIYHTQEAPSLDKIEEQVGVEGKLQRNMSRMRQQYGTPKKIKASAVAATPTPTPAADEKNIREQDSPILKK